MCNSKHKCASIDCDSIIFIEEIWCESCLDKFAEFIEQNPMGFVPSKFNPPN